MLARILSFKIRFNSDLKFQVRVVCKHEEFKNLFYTFFSFEFSKKVSKSADESTAKLSNGHTDVEVDNSNSKEPEPSTSAG